MTIQITVLFVIWLISALLCLWNLVLPMIAIKDLTPADKKMAKLCESVFFRRLIHAVFIASMMAGFAIFAVKYLM